MSVKRSLVVGTITWGIFATEALFAPPITVGGGNDPREMMFRRARLEAVNMVGKLEIYPEYVAVLFGPTDPRTRFTQDSPTLMRLATDIFSSPHEFISEEQPVCAWTNNPDPTWSPPGLDTIRISLPTCGPFLQMLGQSYANFTLIHESVHHLLRDAALRDAFGIEFTGSPAERYEQEEQFADGIAEIILESFQQIIDAGKPHWRDISAGHELEGRAFHSAIYTGDSQDPTTNQLMLVWGGCTADERTIWGCGSYFNDGAIYDLVNQRWQREMSNVDAPVGRVEHGTAWTGENGDPRIHNMMFVWGGCHNGDGCIDYLDNGGLYHPGLDLWTPVHQSPQSPRARSNHTIVWTGDEFIVWGGSTGVRSIGTEPEALNSGSAFDPVTGEWRAIQNTPAEFPGRSYHSAFFTGETGHDLTTRRMIVWGGCDFEEVYFCHEHFNDVAAFDPQEGDLGRWTLLDTSGPAPSPRRLHTGTYIEEHNIFVVWGGQRGSRRFNDGAYLDLGSLRWTRMSSGAPVKRSGHTSVWTGDQLIFFGGMESRQDYAKEIGIYVPSFSGLGAGRWEYQESEFYPIETINHSAVWTPSGMIVFGGQSGPRAFESLAALFVPGEMFP